VFIDDPKISVLEKVRHPMTHKLFGKILLFDRTEQKDPAPRHLAQAKELDRFNARARVVTADNRPIQNEIAQDEAQEILACPFLYLAE
jgi:hypothetical protein